MPEPDSDEDLAAIQGQRISARTLLIAALAGAFIVLLLMLAAHFAAVRDRANEASESAAP